MGVALLVQIEFVEGLLDDVAPVTEKEKDMYKDIDFDVENYRANDIGANRLINQVLNATSFSLVV